MKFVVLLMALFYSNNLYTTELEIDKNSLDKQFWDAVASVESSLSYKDEAALNISKMNDIYEKMLSFNKDIVITAAVAEFNIKYLSLYETEKVILDYYKKNIDKLEPNIYYYRYKLRYLMMLYILDIPDFAIELERLKTQNKKIADKEELNKYLAFFNLIHNGDSASYKALDEVCNSTCEYYPYFHLSKMAYYKKSNELEKLLDYSFARFSLLYESGVDVDNIYEYIYTLSYLTYARNDELLNSMLAEHVSMFDKNSEIMTVVKWILKKKNKS